MLPSYADDDLEPAKISAAQVLIAAAFPRACIFQRHAPQNVGAHSASAVGGAALPSWSHGCAGWCCSDTICISC